MFHSSVQHVRVHVHVRTLNLFISQSANGRTDEFPLFVLCVTTQLQTRQKKKKDSILKAGIKCAPQKTTWNIQIEVIVSISVPSVIMYLCNIYFLSHNTPHGYFQHVSYKPGLLLHTWTYYVALFSIFLSLKSVPDYRLFALAV